MKNYVDSQALADATAKSMYDLDYTAKHMGMDIKAMRPGGCVLSLRVQNWMINGHGICHGGIIFTLADTPLPTPVILTTSGLSHSTAPSLSLHREKVGKH